VKRGARGAVAARGNERLDSPSPDVETVDAIGAGDSFNAGFLHGFARRWPLDRWLHFGNLTGAFSTTAAGSIQAFRERNQLHKFLAEHLKFETPAPAFGTKT
jgi:sugar/nucleoside kinase (ribokinase family)